MAGENHAQATGGPAREPNHGLRIFLIWLVVALAADLLYWFVLGPDVPPGHLGSAAQGQQFDINVLTVTAVPVMAMVLVYFGYSLIVWRQRPENNEDGPAIHGNSRIQVTWITLSTVIVLWLFGFGTYQLINSNGAGGGEGPSPIWHPAGARLTVAQQKASWSPGQVLVVQVIAQQWKFTYRYPQFGGFETPNLVLPDGQWVQFNVTSIDVIHSFWAYQLGVKSDANPGVNNIAFTKTQHLGGFTVRCAELCGLWHGAMFDYGKVVSVPRFQSWVSATSTQFASITKILNQCVPYATTYDPTVIKKQCSGPVMVKLGLTSAGGGFYPAQDPSQP
jgi:cytochrome c oxidase subunit II